MRTSDSDILIIPGLGGSGPDHWQTRWESKLSTARRVEQADWHQPDLDAWVQRIVEQVAASERPVILVAHSLGVWAVAQAAAKLDQSKVKGALLVAPVDAEQIRAHEKIDSRFAEMEHGKLPFPAVLVGSQNDPYASIEASKALADKLGAEFLDAGEAGHINAESGHGPWPEGLMRFAGFLRSL